MVGELYSGCSIGYWIEQIKDLTCRVEELEAQVDTLRGIGEE